jgi:hypothetical protein
LLVLLVFVVLLLVDVVDVVLVGVIVEFQSSAMMVKVMVMVTISVAYPLTLFFMTDSFIEIKKECYFTDITLPSLGVVFRRW